MRKRITCKDGEGRAQARSLSALCFYLKLSVISNSLLFIVSNELNLCAVWLVRLHEIGSDHVN